MLILTVVIVWSTLLNSSLQHSSLLVQLGLDCPEFIWPEDHAPICSCVSIDFGPKAVEPHWYSLEDRPVNQTLVNNVSAKLFLSFNVSDPYPVYYCSEKSNRGPGDIKYAPKFVYMSGEVYLNIRDDRIAFDSPRPTIEVSLCPESPLYIQCDISVKQFYTWTTGFLRINNITILNITSNSAASRHSLFHQFKPNSTGKHIVSCYLRNHTYNDQHQVVRKYNIIANGDSCHVVDGSYDVILIDLLAVCFAVSTALAILFLICCCRQRIVIRKLRGSSYTPQNFETVPLKSNSTGYGAVRKEGNTSSALNGRNKEQEL